MKKAGECVDHKFRLSLQCHCFLFDPSCRAFAKEKQVYLTEFIARR